MTFTYKFKILELFQFKMIKNNEHLSFMCLVSMSCESLSVINFRCLLILRISHC